MQAAVAVAEAGGSTVAVARAVRVVPEPGTKGNPMLTIEQVARRLAVSRKTVRRMIFERRRFPNARRVEGAIRVPEQDVVAYLLSTPVHS